MTDQERAKEIVGKLTEAQRRCVAKMSVKPQLPGLVTFNANAAFNLIRIGVTELGFNRRLLRDTFHLTRLGLAVRALIQGEGEKR